MYELFDYNYFTDELLETYDIDLNLSPLSKEGEDLEDLHKILTENNAIKLNFYL
ncbi:hypothetical protein AAJ76_6100016064 [Vairimorpha ceranae]|uniref:Uncharacterized protein n=1 Tax=Vairimorpha ceranae TaxID=40302 RepID=A0A0F9WCI3_9MICR|nr:hypothetical protein AAJ76_6100016064 [Vairimorpha ceranae]KKO74545.1 hypothetical protein AAJ76_6100016064 [Vairimorpha ceranae]